MQRTLVRAERISDGLGFGEGPISGETDQRTADKAEEAIGSDRIIVPVECGDDGCGDGRRVGLVFRLKERFNRSLHRAKVFGGAVAMTGASLIGTGRAEGMSMEETMEGAVTVLDENEMDFGAHTDDQASGENSGCGAIDNAPKIVRASVRYEDEIRGIIEALGADTGELDTVYVNFRDYVEALPEEEEYSGKRVMGKIVGAGKVIKQLVGRHREKYIVLNTIRGYTVDQELVREQTGGRAEVFAVDIWRLEDIAADLHPEDPEAEAQAYLSELIYTLGTAGILTKGDLPVYLISQE